jgi:PilZ domain
MNASVDSPKRGAERRQYPRTGRIASAAVVVSRGQYVGTYVVEDLSAGGALLVGRCSLRIDDPLETLFQFGQTLTVALSARVVRTQNGAFGIAFTDVAAAPLRALDEVVRSSEERVVRPLKTLIIHPNASTRSSLQLDLASLGQLVVSFAGSRDALCWLESAGPAAWAALVHPDIENPERVLASVAAQSPEARRILIFEPLTGNESLERMITSNLAQALLRNPWTWLSLTSALFFSEFPKLEARSCSMGDNL